MSQKSIIIIGGGLAGLATGCYAQMNGYKTKIFEKLGKPGGVCVSWKRNDYVFDYAIHNVFGTAENSVNSQMWRELGALEGLQTYNFKEFVQVEDPAGKVLTVYADLDKLEAHLKELSPADEEHISEFIEAAKRFSGYDLFAAISGGFGTKLKMLPLMGALTKYSKITLKDYAAGFADPFLRKAFATIQYDLPDVPTVIALIFLASLNRGDGGWPIGGSAALSKNIETHYLKLGGEVTYNSKVIEILVNEGSAVGVKLEDGTEHFADLVVSAADGYSTIFGMLRGKFTNDAINVYYKAYPKLQAFGLEVWYGVNKDLASEPHALVLFLDKAIEVEGQKRDRLNVEIMNFDPTMAPKGKAVVKVVFESDYDYWKKLTFDLKAYHDEKKRVADLVATTLEKRFPQFTNCIEAVDVVTPVSVEHWTCAYRGGQAWGAPKSISKEVSKAGVSKTLPGLRNFYMVGQWAAGTIGLNTVCLLGRNLVRDLCKEDKKKFMIKA